MHIDINRQGLRDTNGIRKLNRAALGQAGRNDIFRQIARRICSRAVYFGRVLARKCAAAMRRGATISIDNDFATGQAGIAIRPTDNESAGRVDVKRLFGAHPPVRQDIFNKGTHQGAHIVLAQTLIMLGRHNHGSGAHRLAIFIRQADLAFAVRPKALNRARFTRRRHIGENFMRKSNRCRHQLFGLATGIAKHNALITCPFILIAAIAVNALRNMRRLSVHAHHHFSILPVKAVLLIANIFDRSARQGFHFLIRNQTGRAHFAGHDNQISGG